MRLQCEHGSPVGKLTMYNSSCASDLPGLNQVGQGSQLLLSCCLDSNHTWVQKFLQTEQDKSYYSGADVFVI